MRALPAHACGTALGYLADLLLGDPRRGHPVSAFGRAAAAAERALWRDHRGAGAVHVAACVGTTAVFAAAVQRAARRADARAHALPGVPGRTAAPDRTGASGCGDGTGRRGRPAAGPAATALRAAVAWSVLGGTSLCREARAVRDALRAGDVAGARLLLPRLCGRDPQSLDAAGIARAVVESVAENTSDAVVGALVWGAAAGTPGMAAFRAVNTLDAMVGHRSPRHLRFGWAAARLDDAAGWPGARLTALLAAVCGPSPRSALRAWRADAHRHPSPNAGPVEAAFAGALGVRLGGTLAYGGRIEHRPVLNGAGRAPGPEDIDGAIRLSRRVGALALLLTAGAEAVRERAAASAAGAPATRAGGPGAARPAARRTA